MIEAANKQLKYQFLYHQSIPDYESLKEFLQKAVEDYNNRPHHCLNGLTPLDVLNGKTFNKTYYKQQILNAKLNRIIENKRTNCSHCL